MAERKENHYRALQIMMKFPEEFNFGFSKRKVIFCTIEPNLLDSGGRMASVPDIVFEARGKKGELEVHIVEYKGTTGNGEAYDFAQRQLAGASWWYGKFRQDVDRVQTHLRCGDDPQYREHFRTLGRKLKE